MTIEKTSVSLQAIENQNKMMPVYLLVQSTPRDTYIVKGFTTEPTRAEYLAKQKNCFVSHYPIGTFTANS